MTYLFLNDKNNTKTKGGSMEDKDQAKTSKTDDVLEKAKKDGVRFIQLQFTDIHGAIKSVMIPIHRLAESLEKGTWFDGSSIEGFTRIAESDMYLKPDISTYALLPWETGEGATARLICDIYMPDGKPFEGDPRYILKRALKEASELGYSYNVGPELEFFLFRPKEDSQITPVTHDKAGYFDFSPKDLAVQVRNDIINALESMGLEVEMSHHEVAPGQHEIDFKYGPALKTADNAITFKHVVKSIAQRHGLYATFMPKPLFRANGSGMHVHQSLFDKDGKNAFFNPDDSYKLSDMAKSFVAGQLSHVKAMSSILAPKVNSYKRLVPGYEAPVYICWAQINRSALIRIPRYSPGRENATRAELRCPDPSCNPYLAFAVMLKSGLDGMAKKMAPPAPVEEDVYEFDEAKLEKKKIDTLPCSLGDALIELKKDKVVQEALGSHTLPIYLAAKKAEYDEYRLQVTSWELEKYFEST
ncbi:type I glutamate--ammonia ligase [Candidatus Woesearchaeota archaeon]|nr:type I glutamate--ammonia ligase [Candidatus Woesearchaeota archaeon]